MSQVRGRKKSRLESAASLLAPVFKRLGISEDVRLAQLRSEWHNIFDFTLTAHMSPSKLFEGELLLHVDSPAWMQQLTFYKRDIIEKLGGYGVKEIRFRIGRVYQHKDKNPGEQEVKFRELSPEDRQLISEAISNISDDGIRDAAKLAMEKSLGRRKTKKEEQ